MIPQKTRVVFQVRVRYAGAYPRKSYLLCGFALPRRIHHPKLVSYTKYASHFQGHLFRIDSAKDLDADIKKWIREAYSVGAQEHLEK